jgi:transposase
MAQTRRARRTLPVWSGAPDDLFDYVRSAAPIADKDYSYATCRALLRQRGIKQTIPKRRDHRDRRRTKPGHPLAFDADAYRRRNVVERCINRLKQWRGVATRYQKRTLNYRARVVISALLILLASCFVRHLLETRPKTLAQPAGLVCFP